MPHGMPGPKSHCPICDHLNRRHGIRCADCDCSMSEEEAWRYANLKATLGKRITLAKVDQAPIVQEFAMAPRQQAEPAKKERKKPSGKLLAQLRANVAKARAVRMANLARAKKAAKKAK